VPETAVRPQDRAEGLSGGAGKRCYGKSCICILYLLWKIIVLYWRCRRNVVD